MKQWYAMYVLLCSYNDVLEENKVILSITHDIYPANALTQRYCVLEGFFLMM